MAVRGDSEAAGMHLRSAIRSLTSSMPTEMRIRSRGMCSSSSGMEACERATGTGGLGFRV